MRIPGVSCCLLVPTLLGAPSAGAQPVTLEGITFSDEHGGIRLLDGWGSGTAADPFVLVEEITRDGPAILTIRGLGSAFGNRVASHHDTGFHLTKVVRNGTQESWPIFDLELRETIPDHSPYEDGLSFGQGSAAGRPFRSDGYPESREIEEPFDGLSFTGAVIPPGATVSFHVVVTDTTPRPLFYLLQSRDRPVAGRGGGGEGDRISTQLKAAVPSLVVGTAAPARRCQAWTSARSC